MNGGPRRWGVLVIHGVGGTEPGVTVDAFVPPLLEVMPTLRPDAAYGPTVLRLADAPLPRPGAAPPGATIDTFPVHVRQGHAQPPAGPDPEPVTFAEVHWSDLSAVGEGRVALIVGMVQTVFSLNHLADQAARQPGWLAQGFRFALWLTARALYGPVAALNALLATGLGIHHALRALQGQQAGVLPGAWVEAFLALASVAALAAGLGM
jgi:hypothetical protein